MTPGSSETFPEPLSESRGQKSDCSGLKDDWEVAYTRDWPTTAKSGLFPVSVNKVFWNAAPPVSVYFVSDCLCVTTTGLNSCHRNHMVCKAKNTFWPFSESFPNAGPDKNPWSFGKLAFLDDACISGDVVEQMTVPLQPASRADPRLTSNNNNEQEGGRRGGGGREETPSSRWRYYLQLAVSSSLGRRDSKGF